MLGESRLTRTSQVQEVTLVGEAASHHFAEPLLRARFQDDAGWKVVNPQFLEGDFVAYAIRCRPFDKVVHQLLVDSRPTRDLKAQEAPQLPL